MMCWHSLCFRSSSGLLFDSVWLGRRSQVFSPPVSPFGNAKATQKQLRTLIEGAADVGVGLAGMRERMRELGGSLEIRSDRAGTTVVVCIPVEKTAIDSDQNGESGRGVSTA